jgi:hypothetical protein
MDSAKQCAKDSMVQGDTAIFVKPIVYFSNKPASKAPEK